MSNKKIFIANKDCDEHNIEKDDKVELVNSLSPKSLEVLNTRTNEYIKLSISEFIKIFK